MNMHLHPASLAPVNSKICRLRAYDKVWNDLILFDYIFPAQPVTVLLHNTPNKIECKVPVETQLFKDSNGGYECRSSAALVNRSPTVYKPVPDLATQRVEAPVIRITDIDSIHVAVYCNNFLPPAYTPYNVPEPVD